MIFNKTTLQDSYLIELEYQGDERGFFARYFCEKEFKENKLNTNWVQINNSLSEKVGTLRGLHFQTGVDAEVKLVRCIKGEIWDVIVDIRKDSKTFGNYFSSKLSAKNRKMIYVPKGFAHGFITLHPNSEVIYLVSNAYKKEAEKTLLWSDPTVGIKWPIKPIAISEKDKNGTLLDNLNAN